MKRRYLTVILLWTIFQICALGQDAELLYQKGLMPGTFINPALLLDKKVNISLAGINAYVGTDGPSISNITSKNTSGKRYIDVKNFLKTLKRQHNISAGLDVHTLDIGIRTGPVTLMAGHGFRSSANVRYPKGLLEIAAKGNAALLGQKVDIGTAMDVLAYNELYLGAQTKLGNFSIGFKGKLLYGAANLMTERSNVLFQTRSEFYQL